MTGVYLIRNRINGSEYIGASIDIHRRFMEHKTPKAKGNDKLHKDIQDFGKENFEFLVIEECSKEELRQRELEHIRSRNPYYNYIGKKKTEEERRVVSEGVKRWWAGVSDEYKQKVIKENLTGPRKGHAVSEETRRKISKKVSIVQKQRCRIIETGEEFESVGDLERHLGAYPSTCAAYWRGTIKSVKGFHVEKCRD